MKNAQNIVLSGGQGYLAFDIPKETQIEKIVINLGLTVSATTAIYFLGDWSLALGSPDDMGLPYFSDQIIYVNEAGAAEANALLQHCRFTYDFIHDEVVILHKKCGFFITSTDNTLPVVIEVYY